MGKPRGHHTQAVCPLPSHLQIFMSKAHKSALFSKKNLPVAEKMLIFKIIYALYEASFVHLLNNISQNWPKRKKKVWIFLAQKCINSYQFWGGGQGIYMCFASKSKLWPPSSQNPHLAPEHAHYFSFFSTTCKSYLEWPNKLSL